MKMDILIAHKSTLKTYVSLRTVDNFKKSIDIVLMTSSVSQDQRNQQEIEFEPFNILKTKFASVLTIHTHKIDADEKGA